MLCFYFSDKRNKFFVAIFFLDGIHILRHPLNRLDDIFCKEKRQDPAHDKDQRNDGDDFRQDLQQNAVNTVRFFSDAQNRTIRSPQRIIKRIFRQCIGMPYTASLSRFQCIINLRTVLVVIHLFCVCEIVKYHLSFFVYNRHSKIFKIHLLLNLRFIIRCLKCVFQDDRVILQAFTYFLT